MAGFVDVSALLQRKSFKLDLDSGRGAEEGGQKSVAPIGPQNEATASEVPVGTRPPFASEQRLNGKVPPKSPQSTLQSSSGGTTPTTPFLQTLVGLVTGSHPNGTSKEKDVAVSSAPMVDESASEPEVKGVAGQSLPVPIADRGDAPGESSEEKAVRWNADGEQYLLEPEQTPNLHSSGAEQGGFSLGMSTAETKPQTPKEVEPSAEEPAIMESAKNVDMRATGAVSGDSTASVADVTEVVPTAGVAMVEKPAFSSGEHSIVEAPDSLQGHMDPPTETKHIIAVQAGTDVQQGTDGGVKETDGDTQAPIVDTGGPAVARQGSGRFSKVGGLLKRTLSFTRGKGGAADDRGGELPGEELPSEAPSKDLEDGDSVISWVGGETSNDRPTGQDRHAEVSIEAPAPQVARADSGRFRSLLKKLIPGAPDAGETAPPSTVRADGGVPVLETFTLPRSVPIGSGEHNAAAAGVSAETPDSHSAGVDTRTQPGVAQQGSGKMGGLLRKLSYKQIATEGAEEAVGGGNVSGTVSAEDKASAFRIPKYLLPGGAEKGERGLELEGVETPPASPMIVFVDSQTGEGDLRRELSAILGAGQVFDTAHLSAADFLGALLPKLTELSHKGDTVAAVVKDNLRVLVVGEDALFKSVSSALQESTAGKSIPVGCIPASGRSSLAQALGLSQSAVEASRQSAMDLLVQLADAGTQILDCWEVKLTTHRKRTASNLPASLKTIPVEGGKSDWVISHQGLCFGSLHLDMGYVRSSEAGGNSRVPQRKAAGWFCGACSNEPLVIRSQNVGRLEIIQNGIWSYLELSPQIRSLEFLNLADARRKMKTLEKSVADAYADDGLIEIVGIQEGSDTEICLAQTNAVRLELFGNAEVDHVKLRLDSEAWVQPLAGESMTDPAVIQITHAGQTPVLVTPTTSLKCTTPAVVRPPVFAPPPLESPSEKAPGLFRRSASPFRKGGRFRSASPFRKGSRSRQRSPSPGPRRSREGLEIAPEPSDAVRTAPDGVRTAANGVQPASESVRSASDLVASVSERVRTSEEASDTSRAASQPRPTSTERVFSPAGRGRRAQSPVPGGRADQEVRAASAPKRPHTTPTNNPTKDYAEAATAAARGGTGLGSRRAGLSLPWTLKVDKLVDTDKVQPQQRLARTPTGSGRQEIYEPVAKTLVRTGSGRLTGDEYGRPPSPSLYRSSSRDNLDQATLSRPASPAPLYRSSSRDNLEQFGGLSRPASPALSRQNSGNTGYSPRVNVLQPTRSESPVQLRERDPTPERLPRMADWATGMSRKSASMTYHSGVLTKQERENAVAIGYGSTLTREERERMQALAFGGASGSDRGVTPQRIRSARARYIGAAAAMYNIRGPLELDLATDDKAESPPPPVRTARDYFSGPLTADGIPAMRRSHA
ncbi:hypothetical protein KFL_003010020 [Klebsormidium nitens]|uniref:DAGKc domain-containing protein n=1 Tax=Klebsormidium nitens TaxID=105231 RepID=A0A1Y1ID44_KLENI|nr:hypothetical protein KFL_003010020 [Klebsormidium nitens]|eukprot:GAQ86626.1 hypothetical protein KFL_003010020 [Klebsormidium nitens]